MKFAQARLFLIALGTFVIVVMAQQAEKKATSSAANKSAGYPTDSQAGTLKLPGPNVQNDMLGRWSIKVNYAPSEKMPNGGVGEGIEVWRPGPGGRSVIEEYHERNATGEVDGIAVAWWDEKANGQRFVWCDNSEPLGCYVSNDVAKWLGNRLVYSEDSEEKGKKITRQEIFSEITQTSFLQVIQEGPAGGDVKPIVTIRAARLSEPATKPAHRPTN